MTEAGANHVDVYFPGHNEIWYDKYTYQQVKSNGFKSIPVTMNEVRYNNIVFDVIFVKYFFFWMMFALGAALWSSERGSEKSWHCLLMVFDTLISPVFQFETLKHVKARFYLSL